MQVLHDVEKSSRQVGLNPCRLDSDRGQSRTELVRPLLSQQPTILDTLKTGSDPSITDYVLEIPGRCLQCGATITEKTLVDLV